MEQSKGSAIDVVAGDDMVATLEQMQHRIFGGHATGESQAIPPVVERRQTRFQRGARRVGRARVVETLVHAYFGLGVRARLIDRHDDRARSRIRILTDVDGACGEPVVRSGVFSVHWSLCRGRRLCWATNSNKASLVIMPT